MTPAQRTAFLEVIVGFAELKGKQLSAPALELYWRALQHWDIGDFRRAAEHLARTCEFMPTPKDFEDLRKAGRPTAGEAWATVLECARKGHELPEDTLIRRAVAAIGGLNQVAMSETDRTPFLERRFCEHFADLQDTADVRESVPQIATSRTRQLSGPQSARQVIARAMPK